MKTEKLMEGTWTLVAPNGNRYHADSPLKCCRSEQSTRVPDEIALQRLADFMEEDEWVSVKTKPTKDMLEHGDWGAFWCFFASEEFGENKQGIRIFTEGSGWNDDGVTHWMPLPAAPKGRT